MTKMQQKRLNINNFVANPSLKLFKKQAKFKRTDDGVGRIKAPRKKPAWLSKSDHMKCDRAAKIQKWVLWLQETGHGDFEPGRPERLLDVCGDAPCIHPDSDNVTDDSGVESDESY
jgi:hypothetical protein